jgi:uncharacterized protein YfiM (DUF2279 family)
MNRLIGSIIFIFFSPFSFGQNTPFFQNCDTLCSKRIIASTTLVGTTWVGGTMALSKIWYSDFQKTNFHTFNDGKDWLQMDKAGHIYTAAHLSESNYRLFKWSGLSENVSVFLGTGVGLGYQTTLEFLDGRNSDWGFSWYDMAANGIGAGLFLSQQLVWDEQRFVLKFSSHKTDFAEIRPNVLGSSFAERLLKDYNGQTYWLSFSPRQFTEEWPLPSWLCLSFGYSVDEKLVGSANFYANNTQTYQATREYLFSLDIDVRELPIQKKWLKAVLRPLHYIKIPFPSVIFQNGKLGVHPFYF